MWNFEEIDSTTHCRYLQHKNPSKETETSAKELFVVSCPLSLSIQGRTQSRGHSPPSLIKMSFFFTAVLLSSVYWHKIMQEIGGWGVHFIYAPNWGIFYKLLQKIESTGGTPKKSITIQILNCFWGRVWQTLSKKATLRMTLKNFPLKFVSHPNNAQNKFLRFIFNM